MFGLVRKSKLDDLAADLEDLRVEFREQRGWLEFEAEQVAAVEKLCEEGGVAMDLHDSLASAVRELIANVHEAASVVAEREKLSQFNRGMLAEREAAKSRHAAA